MKYAAIAGWATDKEYPVTFMCDQLGVARQGYYRWLAEGPCERERTDAELTELIREIHRELHGHPGVRRSWAELVVRGVRVAAKRVWRLMKAAGLRGRHPRAWQKTTVAGQRPIDALAAALLTRNPPPGGNCHSERGCQYTSKAFADFCAINGVRRSMGRRATCYDNAVSESFFATYKKELIHTRPWNGLADVRQHTFLWIEGYYNRRRRHSTLGYLTPVEYELGYRKLTDLAV